MAFLLILAAAFLIAGMVAISLSLLELDRRLADLSVAMDGRYGKWLEEAAANMKKDDDEKGRNDAGGKPGVSIPQPRK